ncbi:hypothetical protein [Mucilaginibacter psychrotolerans]|uniref:Uncharacterized protein n=1 Tax=Mucilaginibacter psychrotolerans TaxID=1524096 RepID=A0A4Y8S9I4_9SPHI|nr:hypothetical protein [Mucilaginibacter psychrotolerans]TFF35046.1 hypothetical protein E2R66_20090 [Mucilaginibacter psychrotolerans]
MTTLTIQIPDSQSSIISAISEITKKAGLSIVIDNDDDDGLGEDELKALQRACEEAVLIKKGLAKATPASEMWDE